MQQFILDRGERNLAKIVSLLSSLSAGKMWKVTVSLYRRDRSGLQNNALWGVAYKIISDETGYELEEVHDYFLRKHFGAVEKWVFDDCQKKPRRTTTTNEKGEKDLLTTVEFNEYYETIQRIAAIEIGVVVPDPDPALRRSA